MSNSISVNKPQKEEKQMSNKDLDTVENALSLLLDDLRSYKENGESLYDWSATTEIYKYEEIVKFFKEGE